MLTLVTMALLAHGAYPAAYQIYEIPSRSGAMVAATTFGLLKTSDDGATWQWICEEAIGTGSSLTPVWRVAPSGELLSGSFRGLMRSIDNGCTWTSVARFADSPDGGQGTGVSDLHSNGTALFATSSKYGVTNGLWRSMNEGVDWQALSPQSSTEFFTTARSAPSRPQRIYLAAWWYLPEPTQMLYVSDDQGDTFTRLDVTDRMPQVPLADGGSARGRGAFYVYAVHPQQPDTFWAVLHQDDDRRHSFVLESRDRGQTFSIRLDSADEVNSVAVSDDGQKLWVGTSGRLFRASSAGAPVLPAETPTRNSCAVRYGDRFYACGWHEVDGFAVAREQGSGWLPVLTWPRVTGVAQCPSDSKVSTVCAGLFPALQAQFPKGLDAGAGGGGGAAGGSGGGGGGGGGCHCATGSELSLFLAWAVVRFGSAHGLRRRRIHR